MPHHKTAIAIPEALLEQVDRAARERGESRSAFISQVLRMAVRARRDADVTRRLNELFAAKELASDTAREADEWEAVATKWGDEDW